LAAGESYQVVVTSGNAQTTPRSLFVLVKFCKIVLGCPILLSPGWGAGEGAGD
jgi:hypothetical protein